MQSVQESYSPAECVRLLEEAQCRDAEHAARALRTVAQRADAPHASVTAAALDLLVVHPAATIPHMPDLISAASDDVAQAVTAFGDLLPTDRGLLVPILAAFAEMPLTRAHEDAARATLRYALTTVDGDDVPVVARALLRCAGAPALARWAVATLRAALRRELTPHVGALLAIVIAEKARARGPIGKALRSVAGDGGISGVDLVTWIVCLQRARAAFDAIGSEITECIRTCVRNGALLASDIDSLEREVNMAGRIAAEMPQGVVGIVDAVVHAFPEVVRQTELGAAIVLVRRLLAWCPSAVNLVLSDLARAAASTTHVRKVAESILLGMVSSVLITPGVRVNFVSPVPVPKVAVVLAMHCESTDASIRVSGASEDNSCPVWNEIFLRMRKGLVFGALSDKIIACHLAYAASCKGSLPVVKQIVSLMHSAIPSVLTDKLATTFLLVLGNALLRGAVDADLAATLFMQRLERQVPKALFSVRDETGERMERGKGLNELDFVHEIQDAKKAKSIRASSKISISVDIAVIKDKPAGSVSAVIGSGLALICRQLHELSPVKPISSLVVNATVLVPAVCLPLYEVAQSITTDATDEGMVNREHRGRGDGNFEPPVSNSVLKVQAMIDAEYQEALEGCMTSIAALIGVVNVSCLMFSPTWQALQLRHEGNFRDIEGAFQDHMWALLDRMSELLVMVHAVALGLDACGSVSPMVQLEVSDSEEEHMDDMKVSSGRQIPEKLKLRLAQTLSANRRRQDNLLHHSDEQSSDSAYPVLTLSAIISALVSVPDEKGLENLQKCGLAIGERDPELGRIEEFLLRRLVCIIQGPTYASSGGEAVRTKSKEARSENPSGSQHLPELGDEEAATVLEALGDMETDLDALLYGEPSDSEKEEEEPRSKRTRTKQKMANIQWESPLPLQQDDLCSPGLFAGCIMNDSISKFGGNVESAEVLYSPEFAALLLDRAATNVMVASQKRRTLQSLGKVDTLKALNSAVGMALCVFVHVLQNVPVLVKMSHGSLLLRINPGRPVSDFVTATGRRMIVHVTSCVAPTLVAADADSSERQAHYRVVEVLAWINKTSIDVASSVLALDCLALLAEHGVVHSGKLRELTLESSSIVHEYDERRLWVSDDFKLVFSQSCQEWMTRRRRAGCGPVFEDELYSGGPWLAIDISSSSNPNFLTLYRLCTIFNGLCTEDAAREACAWAERLSGDLEDKADPKCGNTRKEGKLPRFDSQTTIDFLLNVAQTGLQQVRGSHDFSLSAANVAHTLWFVRTLRGIVGALVHLKFDHRFAHALSMLLGHSRQAVDSLVTQYSAPNTNVPDLEAGVVHDLQQLGVALSQGADDAAKLAAQLKTRSVANAMEARMRRAVLRARHSIPRLQAQAEAARRSAAALTKAVGKVQLLDDVAVGDGVRAWRARLGKVYVPIEAEVVEAEPEMMEGFHSTAVGEVKGNTVVVSFRNVR